MVFYVPSTSLTKVIAKPAVVKEKKESFRDRTEDVIEILTRPIPTHRNKGGIEYTGFSFEGMMGFGKSTLAMLLLKEMFKRYGREKVHLLFGKCDGDNNELLLDLATRNLGNTDVQVVIFDDALFLVDTDKKARQFKSWISNIRHIWRKCVKDEFSAEKDTGIILLFILYQERYDMNSRIRNYMAVQINMQLGNERFYVADAKSVYGDKPVIEAKKRNAMVLQKGKYDLKGRGLVLANFVDGNSGWIHIPLEEDDTSTLEEMADVNLNDIVAGMPRSKRNGLVKKAQKKLSIPADSEAWSGLGEVLADEWFRRDYLTKYYMEGIPNQDNTTMIWSNSKKPVKHTEFQIRERLGSWVEYVFMNIDKIKIVESMNLRREPLIESGEIKGIGKVKQRTYYDYYSHFDNFFIKKRTSKFFGETIEVFVWEKLRKAKELLEESIDDDPKLAEMIKFFIDYEFTIQDGGNDILLVNGSEIALAINVKYSSTPSGKFEATPEDQTAKNNDCFLCIFLVERIEKLPCIKMSFTKPDEIIVGENASRPKITYLNFKDILFKMFQYVYFYTLKKQQKEEVLG